MRWFIVHSIFRKSIPSMVVSVSSSGTGGISRKAKRRRKAVSSRAMERSAVLSVPTTYRLAGMPKRLREYGSVSQSSFSAPNRLSGSNSVMISPNTADRLARLISSISNKWGRAAANRSARRANGSSRQLSKEVKPALRRASSQAS